MKNDATAGRHGQHSQEKCRGGREHRRVSIMPRAARGHEDGDGHVQRKPVHFASFIITVYFNPEV